MTTTYIFREAVVADIPDIFSVRNSVHENKLSDPSVVSYEDTVDYLTKRGKGWVCVADDRLVGFSIADLADDNVWALFVEPEYEGKGIGKELHKLMLDWYFNQEKEAIWLGTDPGTRAMTFYKMNGWREAGMYTEIEMKFEMTREEWLANG